MDAYNSEIKPYYYTISNAFIKHMYIKYYSYGVPHKETHCLNSDGFGRMHATKKVCRPMKRRRMARMTPTGRYNMSSTRAGPPGNLQWKTFNNMASVMLLCKKTMYCTHTYILYEINNSILAVGHLPRMSYYKTVQLLFSNCATAADKLLTSANSRPTASSSSWSSHLSWVLCEFELNSCEKRICTKSQIAWKLTHGVMLFYAMQTHGVMLFVRVWMYSSPGYSTISGCIAIRIIICKRWQMTKLISQAFSESKLCCVIWVLLF